MKPHINTFTGRKVNPFELSHQDIDIHDIAHGLALCNRFVGQTAKPISVAQHSVYVSRLVEGTGHELQGLMHDGSEGYLNDITKWIKSTPELAGYRKIEDHVQSVIYEKFGCSQELADEVEWADRVMVRYEGQQGFKDFKIDHPNYPPLTVDEIEKIGEWGFWTWEQAEQEFLQRFYELTSTDWDV